jgi:hypothetical protein
VWISQSASCGRRKCSRERKADNGMRWYSASLTVAALLPFGCGERYRLRMASEKRWRQPKSGRQKRPRRCRFSIGSAPWQASRNLTLKSVVAKPDRTIKIPGVSWWLPVRSPVPAFRFTGVIPLLWPRLSHSTPDTQFRVGSSLQAGLYARTPVQSDCCALSGNYRLESNPERHEKRHWQQPLVRGCTRDYWCRVLEVRA